jgi:hypothetical protein
MSFMAIMAAAVPSAQIANSARKLSDPKPLSDVIRRQIATASAIFRHKPPFNAVLPCLWVVFSPYFSVFSVSRRFNFAWDFPFVPMPSMPMPTTCTFRLVTVSL